LAATFAGNRLKRFFSGTELDDRRAKTHETIPVRDALEAEDGEEGAQRRGLDDEDERLRMTDDDDMVGL